MTVLLDMDVHSPSEAKNLAFYRKIHKAKIQEILDGAGISTPWALYGFQEDGGIGTDIDNEQGDAAADMTLNDAGMNSGDGWYAPNRGWGSAGMRGFGLQNDNGVSGYIGTIPHSAPIDLDGQQRATFIYVVKASSDGEAASGRVFEKNNTISWINANRVDFYNGATAFTIANSFPYDEWNVVVISFNGTAALGSRTQIYVNGIDSTSVDPTLATIVDTGTAMSILDRPANDRAFDGNIGLLSIIPGYTFTQANVDSIREIRGLFQPTVAQVPVIQTPGAWGPSEYKFDGAGDNLTTSQTSPLKTSQGSLLFWLTINSLAAYQSIISFSREGIAFGTSDEMVFDINATPNANVIVALRVGGVINFAASFPLGGFMPGQNVFVAVTSDGSTIRGYLDGEEVTLTFSTGANTGQWTDLAVLSDRFSIGAIRRNTVQNSSSASVPKTVLLDEAFSPIQIAKIAQSGALGWQRFVG